MVVIGAHADDLLIAGYVEKALVYPGGLALDAKLDTGTTNSSLHVEGIERFRRNGAPWVWFTVTNRQRHTVEFEEQVLRTARIRRHGGATQEREVVDSTSVSDQCVESSRST